MYLLIVAITLLGEGTQVFQVPTPMLEAACTETLAEVLNDVRMTMTEEYGRDTFLVAGNCIPAGKTEKAG